jgi:hypothetical protein
MGKSMWSIAVLGFGALLFMGLFAFMSTPGLEEKTKKMMPWINMGTRLKDENGFRAVRVTLEGEKDKENTVVVVYETTKYLSYSEREVEEELQLMKGKFVAAVPLASDFEKSEIRENVKKMKIVRDEVSGSGCSETHKTAEVWADVPPPPKVPAKPPGSAPSGPPPDERPK